MAALIMFSGCLGMGAGGIQSSSTTTATTNTESPTTTWQTIEGEGKTFLHVSKVDESKEQKYPNATAFENLSEPKQKEFLEAKNCSCQIEASAFNFGDQEAYRVAYKDDIYLIYVSTRWESGRR